VSAAEPSVRRRKEEADMSNPSHLIRAAFNTPNLPRKSIRRRAYVGLLVAAISATVLWSGSAAHSGPCAVKIARLEGQIRHAAPGPENGPTAPQSVAGQLHHQPTPDSVQNAERNARLAAAAALDRVRQADVEGNAVACAKALDEAKHHWIIPPLS
jgi:hypothetical protein